ncbi:MAG: hypothetical protein ACSHWZ_09500 [Sulfitobacter sp.]
MNRARIFAAVAAGLMLGGGAAAAAEQTAWDVFVQRCVAPLEQGQLALPEDLTPARNFKNDGDFYSEYEVAGGDVVLAVSEGGGSYTQWCRVSGPSDAGLAAAVQAWRAGSGFEQEPSGDAQGDVVLRSERALLELQLDGAAVLLRAAENKHGS